MSRVKLPLHDFLKYQQYCVIDAKKQTISK